MTTSVGKILNEVADREAIRECLYRYCRGVDRLDAEMVRSAYWPDVVDTHLGFTGNLEELPSSVLRYLAAGIQRGSLWARWGSVEVEGAPRRRAAGLAAAGMERLVLPMMEDETGVKYATRR